MIKTFNNSDEYNTWKQNIILSSGNIAIIKDINKGYFTTNNINGKLFEYEFDIKGKSPIGNIPYNQLWYKTTDKQPLNITKPAIFNTTIISNVYNGEYGIITFEDELKVIGNGVLEHTGLAYADNLEEIILPNSVEEIKDYGLAFLWNYDSYLILPASLKTLGNRCFQNLGNSKYSTSENLVLDLSLTKLESIDDGNFTNCGAIRHVIFPATLKTINNTNWTMGFNRTIVDFSKCKQVVEFKGKISGSKDTIFVVSDELYNEWITHADWSKYSGIIFKSSQISC